MKLKGINPFEQHVEKIIIGGCGVAFVGALAWQFFFSETDVKVGKDSVPVSRAFEPAEKEAKNKLAAMDDPSPKNLPELPKIDLGGDLKMGQKLALPAVAGTTVAMGRTPGLGSIIVDGGPPTTQCTFAIAKVPAPAAPYALAFRNTVSPVEKLRSAELAKLLPTEQPFDKAAVSVEAEFDGKALFASLLADPDGDAGPLCGTLPNWVLEGGQGGLELGAQGLGIGCQHADPGALGDRPIMRAGDIAAQGHKPDGRDTREQLVIELLRALLVVRLNDQAVMLQILNRFGVAICVQIGLGGKEHGMHASDLGHSEVGRYRPLQLDGDIGFKPEDIRGLHGAVEMDHQLGIGTLEFHQPGRKPESPQTFGHRQPDFAFHVLFYGITGLQKIERGRFHPQRGAVDLITFRSRADTVNVAGQKDNAQRVLKLIHLAPQRVDRLTQPL